MLTQRTHDYTESEQSIAQSVAQFHKNFNSQEWDKNGPLVADDLHVNSNGKELNGRDEFIKHISRFAAPFPNAKITDLYTLVDGNMAAIRFVIIGTQTGDLESPDGVLHATNRDIKVDGIEYFTFNAEGKLVDLVTVEDLAGMRRQLTAK